MEAALKSNVFCLRATKTEKKLDNLTAANMAVNEFVVRHMVENSGGDLNKPKNLELALAAAMAEMKIKVSDGAITTDDGIKVEFKGTRASSSGTSSKATSKAFTDCDSESEDVQAASKPKAKVSKPKAKTSKPLEVVDSESDADSDSGTVDTVKTSDTTVSKGNKTFLSKQLELLSTSAKIAKVDVSKFLDNGLKVKDLSSMKVADLRKVLKQMADDDSKYPPLDKMKNSEVVKAIVEILQTE